MDYFYARGSQNLPDSTNIFYPHFFRWMTFSSAKHVKNKNIADSTAYSKLIYFHLSLTSRLYKRKIVMQIGFKLYSRSIFDMTFPGVKWGKKKQIGEKTVKVTPKDLGFGRTALEEL